MTEDETRKDDKKTEKRNENGYRCQWICYTKITQTRTAHTMRLFARACVCVNVYLFSCGFAPNILHFTERYTLVADKFISLDQAPMTGRKSERCNDAAWFKIDTCAHSAAKKDGEEETEGRSRSNSKRQGYWSEMNCEWVSEGVSERIDEGGI